jgi:uncharacterized membrane protein YoaK (UPF0700 family)
LKVLLARLILREKHCWLADLAEATGCIDALGFEGFDGLTTESTTGAELLIQYSFIREEHWMATQL